MNALYAETESFPCPICGAPAHYSHSGRDVRRKDHKRYDYHVCQDCGACFLCPMPDEATVSGFYPEEYVKEDDPARPKRTSPLRQAELRRHHGYAHLSPGTVFRALAALLAPFYRKRAIDYVPGGSLLDVGCGNGRYLKTMRSLGWNVRGVEFNRMSVEHCQRDSLEVHCGDLASANFPAESFDVIAARHVIEHIPAPQAFMAELARLLKPGGVLVVETPNYDSAGWSWFATRWYASAIPYHLMLFSPGNLTLLAQRHGLILRNMRLETSPKFFLNSIDNLAVRQGRPSRRIAWRRWLARCYVWHAQKTGRGDVIHAVFARPMI